MYDRTAGSFSVKEGWMVLWPFGRLGAYVRACVNELGC